MTTIKMKEMVGGCCVCSDERGWTENPLVYCDGNQCNVAVHQACYGIVQVPTGPWFCRKCESQERQARVRCELCPSKDGALKRTDNGGWAHVVCSLYIPEVRFGNVSTMEPIILQLVPPERYHKTCYICEEQGKESKASVGACMQCNKPGCKQHFHVTCAQAAGLLCEEAGNYNDNVKYCGYCAYHYQKLKKDGHNIKPIPAFKPVSVVDSAPDSSPEKKSCSVLLLPNPTSNNLSPEGNKSFKKKTHKAPNSEGLGSNVLANDTAIPTTPNSRPTEPSIDAKPKPEKKRKRSSTASVNSSASQSPLASSPIPVNSMTNSTSFNNSHFTSLPPSSSSSSSASTQNSSPNPTPSFTAMYGTLTNREHFSGTNQNKEKAKGDKHEDCSLPGSPRPSKPSSIEKKKKSLILAGTNKISHVSKLAKEPSHPKKSKRKKNDVLKEINSDSEMDRNSKEKSPIRDKSKLSATESSSCRSRITEPPQSVISKSPEVIPSSNRPFETQSLEDFAIPPPPSAKNRFEIPPKEPIENGPQTLEQLLERQWTAGTQLIMEQAQHFDIASLLSCLYQLRNENDRLEERVKQLITRRDHLIIVNSRLSLPLNGNLHQSNTPNQTNTSGSGSVVSVSQHNGSANSVSSSPLSFPSTNSGANPSPVNLSDGRSPRSSPAKGIHVTNNQRSVPCSDRFSTLHQVNGEHSNRIYAFPTIPQAQYGANVQENHNESSVFQVGHQSSLHNASPFPSTSCIRSPEKR